MKYIVDIHGELNGDYEIIKKYDEPKTGKWIVHKDGWKCSECGEFVTSGFMGYPRYNCCPMCMADMREGEQE